MTNLYHEKNEELQLIGELEEQEIVDMIANKLFEDGGNLLLWNIVADGFQDHKHYIQDADNIENEEVVEIHDVLFLEYPDVYNEILLDWANENDYL